MSENKEAGGRRRRRRSRRKPTNDAESRPWSQGDPDAVEQALARFNQSPPPMGMPESIDPPPQERQLKWKTNAVPKNIQRKVGDIVCKPGEFGFLPEERVDEIQTIPSSGRFPGRERYFGCGDLHRSIWKRSDEYFEEPIL